jgi:hypothetical protein
MVHRPTQGGERIWAVRLVDAIHSYVVTGCSGLRSADLFPLKAPKAVPTTIKSSQVHGYYWLLDDKPTHTQIFFWR